MLGLLLFGFFFSIVALNTLGIVPSGAEGSPDDPPPSAEARFGAAHPGEAVHAVGAVAVVVIGASGLMAMIVRPERPGHAYQVLAAMAGVLLTLPIVGDPDNVGGQAGPIDPFLLLVVVPAVVAALLAAPWRRRGSDDRWRTRLLAFAAIGAGSFPAPVTATWSLAVRRGACLATSPAARTDRSTGCTSVAGTRHASADGPWSSANFTAQEPYHLPS